MIDVSNSAYPNAKCVALGLLGAFAAVLIGAGWQIVTRLGVISSLQPVDLALLRYGFPAIVLFPVLLKSGPLPSAVDKRLLFLVVLGGGLPFGLLAMIGSKYAPVAHMGVIIPCGMSLVVAALSWWLMREKYSVLRVIGLCLLSLAIITLGINNLGDMTATTIYGDLFFLAAAGIWAVYTISFRKSGLKPLQAAAIISFWSLIFIIPIWILTPETRLLSAPISDVGLQFVWQSILAGIVASWAYGVGVKYIGPSNSAAIGALLPVFASIGGFIFLNEKIEIQNSIAIFFAVVGVLLSTGWLIRKKD